MKRILLILILFGISYSFTFSNADYPAVWGFNEYDLGSSASSGYFGRGVISQSCTGGYAEIINDSTHLKVLKLYHPSSATSCFVYYYPTPIQRSNNIKKGYVEFWAKAVQYPFVAYFIGYPYETGAMIAVDPTYLYIYYGGVGWKEYPFEGNKWHHYRVYFDYNTNKYDVYVDGVLIAKDFPFYSTTPTQFDYVRFQLNGVEERIAYIDAIGYSWLNYTIGDNELPIKCGDNIIDYYKDSIEQFNFDECDGTTATGIFGNAGILSGQWGSGVSGCGLFLNGFNNGVSFSIPIQLPYLWSVSAWFRERASTDNALFEVGGNPVYVQSNILGAYIGGSFVSCGYDMSTLSYAWHNLVVVQRKDGLYYYIDGEFVCRLNVHITGQITKIGNSVSGSTPWGELDEFKVFDKPLSLREIYYLSKFPKKSFYYDDHFNNGTLFCYNGTIYSSFDDSRAFCEEKGGKYVFGDWYEPGWKFRKKILVSSSVKRSNYPVAVNPNTYNTTNLVLSYHFNDDTKNKTFIKDYSNTGLNATLYGYTLGLWHFDGSTSDQTQYNNPATINTATYDTGISNQGIKTDGISTYAYIPHSTAYENLVNYSIAFWVKPGSGNVDENAIVEKWSGSGPYPFVFRYRVNEGISFNRYDGTTGQAIFGTYPLLNDSWYFIVGTVSGDTMTLYINGNKISSSTVALGSTANAVPIYLGSRGGTRLYFNGTIDELAIYNKTLSDDDVMNLYKSQKAKFLEYTDGVSGGGVEFKHSKVQAPYSSLLGLNTFSVNSWVYLYSTPPSYGAGVLSTRDPANDYTFDFKITDTSIHGDIGDGTSWLTTSADCLATLSLNEWHMITYNVFPGGYEIYLDGNLCSSGSFTGTPLLMKPGQKLNIGWSFNDEYFNGKIDEIRVYNRKLSLNEIKEIYYQGKGRLDYGDLRFVYDGSVLDYKCINDNSCIFKTNIYPGNNYIYMYYGNPNASSGMSYLPYVNQPLSSTTFGEEYLYNNTYLISYYNFDNSTTSLIKDLVGSNIGSLYGYTLGLWHFDGSTSDQTQYNNPATINTATYDTGISNQGIKTDGISTYAYIPHSTAYENLVNYSIAFWVKPGSGNVDENAIVEKWADLGSYPFAFRYRVNEGIGFYRWDGTTAHYVYGNTPFTDGTWYFIVGTVSGDTMTLYINGNKISSSTVALGSTANAVPIYLGSRGGTRLYFNGTIDELAIYNKTLTDDEVSYLYNSQKAKFLEYKKGHLDQKRGVVLQNSNNISFSSPGPSGVSARSILLWVKANDSDQSILSYGDNTLGGSINININSTGTCKGLTVDIGGGALSTYSYNFDGNWHFIAIVIPDSSTLSQVDVYVDGNLLTPCYSSLSSTSINTGTTNPLVIGRNIGSTLHFSGEVDELRIFNYALIQSEIQHIYERDKLSFGCCVSDIYFYNSTILCSDGSFNTNKDINKFFCRLSNNWLYNYISGNYASCCGDDTIYSEKWDFFFNNTNICYNGNILSDFDISKDFCELSYNWIGYNNFISNYTTYSASELTYAKIADLNNDGKNDYVLFNKSGVVVNINGVSTTYSFPYATAGDIGDIDNDGDLDIVAVNSTGYIILFNDGSGNFVSSSFYEEGASFIQLGDVNNDNYLDMVISNSLVSKLYINLGGAFKYVSDLSGNSPTAFADLNNDGYVDLITSDATGVYVNINNKDNTFSSTHYSLSGSPEGILVYDIDKDGDIDVVVGTINGVNILYNDGSGSFTLSYYSLTNTPSITALDIEGDGDIDLVAAVQSSAQFILFNNTGSGYNIQYFNLNQPSYYVTSGDIDNDGDSDLLFAQKYWYTINWNNGLGGKNGPCCGDDSNDLFAGDSCCCKGSIMGKENLCDIDNNYLPELVCVPHYGFCNSTTSPTFTLSSQEVNPNELLFVNISSPCLPSLDLIYPNQTKKRIILSSCGSNCFNTSINVSDPGFYHLIAFNGKYSYSMFVVRNQSITWQSPWSDSSGNLFKYMYLIKFVDSDNVSRIYTPTRMFLSFNETVYCDDLNNDGIIQSGEKLGLRMVYKDQEIPIKVIGKCINNNLSNATIIFPLNMPGGSVEYYKIYFGNFSYVFPSYKDVVVFDDFNRYIDNYVSKMEFSLTNNVPLTLISHIGSDTSLQKVGGYILDPLIYNENAILHYLRDIPPSYEITYAPYEINYNLNATNQFFNQSFYLNSYYSIFNASISFDTSIFIDWLKYFDLNIDTSKFTKIGNETNYYLISQQVDFPPSTKWVVFFNENTGDGLALIKINSTDLSPRLSYSSGTLSYYAISTGTTINAGDKFSSRFALITFNYSDSGLKIVDDIWHWLNYPVNYSIVRTDVAFDIVNYTYDKYIDRSNENLTVSAQIYSNTENITALHVNIFRSGNLTVSRNYNCSLIGNFLYECNFSLNMSSFPCDIYDVYLYGVGVSGNTTSVNFSIELNDIFSNYVRPGDTLISTNQTINVSASYCGKGSLSNIYVKAYVDNTLISEGNVSNTGFYLINYTNPLNVKTLHFKVVLNDSHFWDINEFDQQVVKSSIYFNAKRVAYPLGSAGYRSNYVFVSNPSSNPHTYYLGLVSSGPRVRFSSNKQKAISFVLPPHSSELLFIDVFPLTAGTFPIVVRGSSDVALDSESDTFNVVVQTYYSIGAFNFVLADSYDFLSTLLFILLSIFILSKSFK